LNKVTIWLCGQRKNRPYYLQIQDKSERMRLVRALEPPGHLYDGRGRRVTVFIYGNYLPQWELTC